MRILLPTFALALLAGPALAGSIEPVTGATAADSISTITCEACPALKPKPVAETYHVDAIAPGTQKVEIREENGEHKLFRTEAWMGGSPVLFVSKAPAETVDSAETEQPVDTSARTSALGKDAAQATVTAGMTASREFDPGKFELRLD